jgi:hypothetical protein
VGFAYSAPCPAAIPLLSYQLSTTSISVATREAFPQDAFTCLVASLDGLDKEQ